MLDNKIFENADNLDVLIKKHPGYFNIEEVIKLIKVLENLKIESNPWQDVFVGLLYKKLKKFKKNNIKILILVGIKGSLIEALCVFLKKLNIQCDLLECTHDETLFNFIKKIGNVNFNITADSKNFNYSHYEYIISVGATYPLIKLLKSDIKSKLILLDFALYHAIINEVEKYSKDKSILRENDILEQNKELLIYTCQPYNLKNVYKDVINFNNTKIKSIDYMPVNLRQFPIIKTDNSIFDLVILGLNGRDFSILKSEIKYFKNKKILIINSNNKYYEDLSVLKRKLNIKIIPMVKFDFYLKLIAVSKIVFIPIGNRFNGYLSISDALAMGKALITSHTPALFQILNNFNSPLIAIKNNEIRKLKKEIDKLLFDEDYRQCYERRARLFARKNLNIDIIYFNIFKNLFYGPR